MESRAKAAGHAIHPMVIVFPLGLFATAVAFDILFIITGRDGFTIAAGYVIAAGILGGLLAAVFGYTDWLAIPRRTRAKMIGAWHGLGNVVVVALFAVSWLLRVTRDDNWKPSPTALGFSFGGLALAVVTSWLGGELVERLGIGVDPQADVNAPSSLRREHRPAGMVR